MILVATPIGNLGDLAPRAASALAGADLICCEDTRRTGRLLQHAGIAPRRLRRVDDHTERAATGEVLELLQAGKTVALVSDAGTPGISDPGHHLVRAVIDAGQSVSAVPGPAALVMALVVSGLPCDRFVYEGFLPRSGSARAQRLDELATQARTVVLYEAPHRVERTLSDLVEVCGPERRVALCRELTKLHEEIWRGTLAEAVEHLGTHPALGEYVVVLAGAPAPGAGDDQAVDDALRAALARGLGTKEAAAHAAATTGRARREVYARAVALRGVRPAPSHRAPKAGRPTVGGNPPDASAQ